MVLAVEHRDADVLHRKPRDRTVLENLLDALAHRGHELVRNDAALGGVDEIEAAAARKRLDAQAHFAELPRAAGLLLVAVCRFGLTGDRLAIRNARRPRVDLDLVLRGHALEHRS